MELKCTKCEQTQDSSEFAKAPKTTRGFSSYCKLCARLYNRLKNPRPLRINKLSNSQHLVTFFKRESGCSVCKESEPCCLEFHHKERDSKTGDISQLTKKYKKINDILVDEISKCIILCSNCHKKHHSGLINVDDVPVCEFSYEKIEEIKRHIKFQGV